MSEIAVCVHDWRPIFGVGIVCAKCSGRLPVIAYAEEDSGDDEDTSDEYWEQEAEEYWGDEDYDDWDDDDDDYDYPDEWDDPNAWDEVDE